MLRHFLRTLLLTMVFPGIAFAQQAKARPVAIDDVPALLRHELLERGTRATLTQDGGWVVILTLWKTYVVPAVGGERRELGPNYFRFTPDGRYAVATGAPFTRISLRDTRPPLELFPDARFDDATLSNDHLAVGIRDGYVTLIDLESAKRTRVNLGLHEGPNCLGFPVPRYFSADGRKLLVSHGCKTDHLVQTKSGALQRVPLVRGNFAGDLVYGSPEGSDEMVREIVVFDPKTRKSWRVENVDPSPFRRAVQGHAALLQVANGEVQYIDLRARTVRVLDAGPDSPSGSFDTTPDGKTALYVMRDETNCRVRKAEIASGEVRTLIAVDGNVGCWIQPLDDGKAAIYITRSDSRTATVAEVDLSTGKVRQRRPAMDEVGTLHTAGRTLLISGRNTLYVGTSIVEGQK